MDIGKSIKRLRAATKMNQMAFANKMNISQGYLSQIECNHKKPSFEVLEKICEVTERPLAVLFWFTLTKDDISEEKQDAFNMLKPMMDKLIDSLNLKTN